jgi:dephospho-CoA kinase
VALTGGIACGKSAALAMFAELGARVIDADDVAHEWMGPGASGAAAVAREFGEGILRADGSVDRAALGRLVFGDDGARRRLNALSHPAVREILREWRDGVRAEGAVGVAAIPLLYESGMEGDWDGVACIVSDDDAVRARLAARGLNPAEAQARLDAQWPVEEKARRADCVIENRGTLEELRRAVERCFAVLRQRGKGYR